MAFSSGTVPKQIFREYDIRGVADRDLSDDLVHAIGQCFGRMVPLGRERVVAVGRDCRLSSPRLFSALTTGLTEVGCSVKAIGVGPTPQLYFAAHYLKSAASIMITGSHNPGDENGFKMMLGTSSFYGQQIQELLEAVETQDATFSGKLGTVQVAEVEDAYVDAMKERFNFSRTRQTGPEVRPRRGQRLRRSARSEDHARARPRARSALLRHGRDISPTTTPTRPSSTTSRRW